MAYTGFGGNVSYGTASQSRNDASAGDVAWTNLNNIGNDGAVSPFESCTLSDGETSQWLLVDNLVYERDIPSGATVLGCRIEIFWDDSKVGGGTPPFFLEDLDIRLVKEGTILTTNKANGQQLGISRQDDDDRVMIYGYYGGIEDLWSESFTATEAMHADTGIAIRVQRTDDAVTETDYTARIRSVLVHWYWEGTESAVLTSIGDRTSGMAPFVFHAEVASQSVLGRNLWKDCRARFDVTEFPEGWEMKATDPRNGDWGTSRERDCANDAWGYNMAWLFDVPGTYKVKAFLYTPTRWYAGSGLLETNEITVTVSADTRTEMYVSGSGNDSTGDGTEETPYATIAKAASVVTSNTRIIVSQSDPPTETVASEFSGELSGIVLESSSPTLNAVVDFGDHTLFVLASSTTDMIVRGIKGNCTAFTGDEATLGDNTARFLSFQGSGHNYNAVIDCESENSNEGIVFTGDNVNKGFLIWNFNCYSFIRYRMFAGSVEGLVLIGGEGINSATPANGESHLRLSANGVASAEITKGRYVNFLWQRTDSTPGAHTAIRMGWSYQHCYQSQIKANAGEMSFGMGENSTRDAQHNHTEQVWDGIEVVTSGSKSTEPGPTTGRGRNMLVTNCFGPHGYASFNVLVLSSSRYMNGLKCDGTGTSGVIGIGSGGPFSFWDDFRFNGNLWTFEQESPTVRYIRAGVSADNVFNPFQAVDEFRYNAIPVDGTDRFSEVAGDLADLAAYESAYSGVDNNVVESGLSVGSLLSSRNYGPPEAVEETLTVVDPEAVPGVYVDYRGVVRDPTSSTWLIGPMGLEEQGQGDPEPGSPTEGKLPMVFFGAIGQ